jgi:hypothetical protein
MENKESIPDNLFIDEGKTIEGILRKPAQYALLTHRQANNYVASWRDDRVVILTPKEILDELIIDTPL